MPLRPIDRPAFVEMLTAVAAIYGREMSAQTIAIYWQALSAYDIGAVRQGLDRHVKNPDTGQFMPKPADLIRMLGGTTQDAALVAWSKVERAMRLVGSYSSIVFDDPVIHRVIEDMGGWVPLNTVMTDELPFRAKEFENRYRGYAMRRELPSYSPQLAGREELHNSALGYDQHHVALFGDVDMCRQVIASASASKPYGINFMIGSDAGLTKLAPTQ